MLQRAKLTIHSTAELWRFIMSKHRGEVPVPGELADYLGKGHEAVLYFNEYV